MVADDGSVSSELLYGSIDSGFEELIDYLFSLEVQQIRSSIRQDLSLPYGKGTFDISIYSNDDTISGSLVSMNVEGPGSFTISVNQGHKSHYHHYVLENDEIFDINYIFSFFDELD